MIHYHGTSINPIEVGIRVLRGRHAFISYVDQGSLGVAVRNCQSFALDNGAYSFWRKGVVVDWDKYYRWVENLARIPHMDFAIIPDIIDGTEKENDALIADWPLDSAIGVPVWHLHESLEKLKRLAKDWHRIALGSSGAYDTPCSNQWWMRMQQAMDTICDKDGYPITKLHGLRMLNPQILRSVPLSSGDSTFVCQKKGLKWKGQFEPATPATKAVVIAERIELIESATRWTGWRQDALFD